MTMDIFGSQEELFTFQSALYQRKIHSDIKICLINHLNLSAPHPLSICFVLHYCSRGSFMNGYLSSRFPATVMDIFMDIEKF